MIPEEENIAFFHLNESTGEYEEISRVDNPQPLSEFDVAIENFNKLSEQVNYSTSLKVVTKGIKEFLNAIHGIEGLYPKKFRKRAFSRAAGYCNYYARRGKYVEISKFITEKENEDDL